MQEIQDAFRSNLEDQLNALRMCASQLLQDPQAFAGALPIVLSQVSIQDPLFRTELLDFLALVFQSCEFYTQQIKFAVVAGCLEAICYMMADENIVVQKSFVLTMTNALPIIFKTLYSIFNIVVARYDLQRSTKITGIFWLPSRLGLILTLIIRIKE